MSPIQYRLQPFVRYTSRIEDDEQNVSSADGLEAAEDDEEDDGDDGQKQASGEGAEKVEPAELWDLLRPLIGNCELRLLKFDDKEAQVRNVKAEESDRRDLFLRCDAMRGVQQVFGQSYLQTLVLSAFVTPNIGVK